MAGATTTASGALISAPSKRTPRTKPSTHLCPHIGLREQSPNSGRPQPDRYGRARSESRGLRALARHLGSCPDGQSYSCARQSVRQLSPLGRHDPGTIAELTRFGCCPDGAQPSARELSCGGATREPLTFHRRLVSQGRPEARHRSRCRSLCQSQDRTTAEARWWVGGDAARIAASRRQRSYSLPCRRPRLSASRPHLSRTQLTGGRPW